MLYTSSGFDSMDYLLWAIKVKLIMDAHDIWETVEPRVFDGRISQKRVDRQWYGCQDKEGNGQTTQCAHYGSGSSNHVALDVAEEEVVDPQKVKMVMNVSDRMPSYMLHVL